LPVKKSPGFLVTAALTPYMLEAMILLDQKVPMGSDRKRRKISACRWAR